MTAPARPSRAPAPVVHLAPLFDRPVPSSPMAEAALLGAMILEPSVIPDAAALLPGPDAFYVRVHGVIYAAVTRAFERDRTLNLVLLAEELGKGDGLGAVGGLPYLEKLVAETPGPATTQHYARIVAEKHRRRLLVEAAGTLAFDAYTEGESVTVAEIAARAMERVLRASAGAQAETRVSMDDAVESVFEMIRAGRPACWETSSPTFNRDIGGIPKGDVTTIMSRPSCGKTTWMLQELAYICTANQTRAWVFSNEQNKTRVAATLLTQHAAGTLNVHDILNAGRGLRSDEWRRLEMYGAQVRELPIELIEQPMNAAQIFNMAQLGRRLGVEIIAVDYIQDLPPVPGFEQGEARISEGMRQLKRCSRELGMTTLVVSQMGKDVNRDNRRPTMADGLGSGAIEQCSGMVLGLHRPHQDEPCPSGSLEQDDWRHRQRLTTLIGLKVKYGARGEVPLEYDARNMCFTEPRS